MKVKKIISRVVLAIACLVLASLIFIYFSDDYSLYIVRSESMRPTINMGDLVITGPVDGPIKGELKPGTIVTYEHARETVTHRVESINGATLVTRGDAAEEADPWKVELADVKGVFLFKVPYMGYATSFIQSRFGWFMAIIVPAAALVLWLVKDIVKEALSSAQTSAEKGR